MIVIYHHNGKVTQISELENQNNLAYSTTSIDSVLFELAGKYPNQHLIWCDETFRNNLNRSALDSVFHHKKIMASYQPNGNFLPEAIGYIEESSFININKSVAFPTWRMSAAVGGIHAEILNAVGGIEKDSNFGYFLNSFAKRAMPLGLFCYSDPKLLTGILPKYDEKSGNSDLFRFVRQHYKSVWVWLILLDLLVYQRKFPLLSAIGSLFYKRRTAEGFNFDKIEIQSRHELNQAKTLDVVIPTIGRKPYLHDVLKDLSKQTLLPNKIIIVEQNPEMGSESQLDYLENESWPFKIKHLFIHQSGACNARNLALKEVSSDWIFLADDDIRMETDFLALAFEAIYKNSNQVFNFSCLNVGQPAVYKSVHQTSIFGSGCSIISRQSLGDSKFDMAFEFGFSEDLDFAMQLMNKGFDTYYIPQPALLHLKAPVGGFRTKPILAWANDSIQPKPSPTVMLYRLKHHSHEQLLGYKMILFFKFYLGQPIKNPIKYLKNFRKMWIRSLFWANHLKELNK